MNWQLQGRGNPCLGAWLWLAGALLLLAPAQAQQAVPGLHTRPNTAQSAEQQDVLPPTVATGRTDLPPAAEGEYPWKSWRGDGEVDLYFENGRLQGYMEEPQSAANQTGSPLTFNFTATHVDGPAVSFTTRTLHGSWYSFDGHLERGLAADPSKSGYYRLTGTLTEHDAHGNAVPHTVSLPREPGTD